jgi:site-specific recombinase XerD
MTQLRKMMLEELERRNYAQTTIGCYIQTIEDFARHFRCPPDQLSPEHIREYQAYLFRERKLAASTVTQRLAALRFFYTQTITKAWSVADTPYPKKTRHLPTILSPEEVAGLIDSARTPFHHIVLMTLYGTGTRRAELARLQIPDIDSCRMVIHIRGGKGRQDREVLRRCGAGGALCRPLPPLRRHLQPSTRFLGRREGHLSLARLRAQP